MIEFNQVTKSFAQKKVLTNINLRIIEGELLILLGPSGSGKTTLLKHINGLLVPNAGTITYRHQPISQLDQHMWRRKTGYVIQDVGLMPHLTVAQNINLPRKIAKLPAIKVTPLLSQVQLPEIIADRYPEELSGGQQQRVGIARALANEPELILMDEPFSSLDNITRKQLQEDFLKLEKLVQSTIVMVTHDIQEAFLLADRIVIMHEGEIAQVGKPIDLLTNPQSDFIREFLKNDQLMLLLRGIRPKDLGFEDLIDESLMDCMRNSKIETEMKTVVLKKFFELNND